MGSLAGISAQPVSAPHHGSLHPPASMLVALPAQPSCGLQLSEALVLIEASCARLNESGSRPVTVDPSPSEGNRPSAGLTPGSLLRDCAATLAQLQVTLRAELAQRQRLELDLAQAQRALSETKAELRDTQVEKQRALGLARRDSLTSLPNRGFFLQRLKDALARAGAEKRPLAVFYLDLDGFKSVNDTHGHDVGDHVLRIVAARLNRATRVDDVVGRLGGDEFACLLLDAPGPENLAQLGGKLIDAVSARFNIGELRLDMRASIGASRYPHDGEFAEDLLKSADAAMYRAKRLGSGFAMFDPGVDA